MLTLSERWLTTQASVSVRALTVTGSRPTGMVAWGLGLPSLATAKTSRVAAGGLTARRRAPDGVGAIGWRGEASKLAESAAGRPGGSRKIRAGTKANPPRG